MLDFAAMVSLMSILCTLNLASCERSSSVEWHQQRTIHEAVTLGNNQLSYLASLSNMQQFDTILNPILVPRAVGTQNHAVVNQYLKDHMTQLGWTIDTDRFSTDTPLGKKTFENIIATHNPQATRRLVLACHYDSKYTRSGKFIGATDSAVPCAMMINLAKDLKTHLDQQKTSGNDISLQFIFFDGEEAFKTWTSRDSIYGSRHLATKLANTRYPENSNSNTNHLHRMDLMVLLDLLGAPNPTFYNYIRSGDRWFRRIADVEERLRDSSLIDNPTSYFSFGSHFGGIEDDHVPFMKRGVPVLHLITSPFPSVWHTDADDKSALDYPTIDNLNKILRVFVAEYLGFSIA